METRQKTVLISGASTGIGKQCALRLAKAGYRVYAGVRDAEAGEQLLRDAPAGIEPIELDVTDMDSIRRAADKVSSGPLDGLVNNAGIALIGPFEFLSLEKIRQQFEVNLFGHIAVTQSLLPRLRETEGRIVNMGSISGLVAFPFAGTYACTKFAMEAFSDSLRRELKPWNIHVSLVEPGNIKTPLWNKSSQLALSAAAEFPPEAMEYYGKALMKSKRNLEAMKEPSAVAEAVLRALAAKRPKARYHVGRDAHLWFFARRLLPDALLDRIATRKG